MAILDEESLLATCAYIDLNPVAAGIAAVPEASPYTSVKARVDHATEQGRSADLQAAEQGSVAGSCASAGIEESLWLCPIEDRCRLDSTREGMLEGFCQSSNLSVVRCPLLTPWRASAVLGSPAAGWGTSSSINS